MSKHLAILQTIFPDQVYLTPKQVARALYGAGKETKKRTENVRRQLDNGTLLPGIQKAPGDKRWKVKIVDLASALDGEVARRPAFEADAVIAGRRSRFKHPGPRLAR